MASKFYDFTRLWLRLNLAQLYFKAHSVRVKHRRLAESALCCFLSHAHMRERDRRMLCKVCWRIR